MHVWGSDKSINKSPVICLVGIDSNEIETGFEACRGTRKKGRCKEGRYIPDEAQQHSDLNLKSHGKKKKCYSADLISLR